MGPTSPTGWGETSVTAVSECTPRMSSGCSASWPWARRCAPSEPATAGWAGNRLYLQVYPSKTQTEEIDTARLVSVEPARGTRNVVRAAAGRYADIVDWRAVDKAAHER